LKRLTWLIVAVVVGVEGKVMERKRGIIGTDSSIINSSSRILNNNNNTSRISNRIRVVFLSLHSLMGLFLVGCLLLGLSRVLTLNSLLNSLVLSQTNGLHLL
jgi:hypothetical protein